MTKLLYIVNPELTCWDIMLVRAIISVIFVGAKAKMNEVDLFRFHGQGVKLFFGVSTSVIWYLTCLLSYKYISVTKATLIIYANPIVIIVLAYFILKENVTKYDVLCLLLVIAGCFLITNNSDTGETVSESMLGYLFAIISWVSMGCLVIFIRVINQVLNHLLFVFYMSLLSIVPCVVVFLISDGIHIFNWGMADLLMLVIIAFGGIIGQIFSGLAYKYAEASKLGPFWNLEVVFLWVLEGFFLSYRFSLTDFYGGAFIIGALLLSIMIKSQSKLD